MRREKPVKRIVLILLLLSFLTGMVLPLAAYAQEKIVRVGWYDSSFCYFDEFGRRCGIDCE